ncbi:MAG: glutamine synthetase beta-grasp domain-containing protein [Rickettsiales bacterium]|nr:glutamine synthetase beta-grasp domain-containing protein [Rickettsiales bacterium]
MSKLKTVEYIWLDGTKPVSKIRSKTRIVELSENPKISDLPEWNFDGSSTEQASGNDSDCLLNPVCIVNDPIENCGDYLVLCEVLNPDGTEHSSNSRARLRKILDSGINKQEPWIGFEQEYTMFKRNIPLGWPEHGFPAPQGPYYCGVGSEQIFGRDIALEHKNACLRAGLIYYGMNAEVMPGQWEFQIGYRGVKEDDPGVLNVADHMWIARWLLHHISEKYNIHISLDNKPVKGDWNGAGMHTNFSTKSMRDPKLGKDAIEDAISRLEKKHHEHIEVYGDKLEERLTGLHETSDIHQFSSGDAHRGSSIRIPRSVSLKGHGYIEDRRPGANADPYLVAAKLIETICNL